MSKIYQYTMEEIEDCNNQAIGVLLDALHKEGLITEEQLKEFGLYQVFIKEPSTFNNIIKKYINWKKDDDKVPRINVVRVVQ